MTAIERGHFNRCQEIFSCYQKTIVGLPRIFIYKLGSIHCFCNIFLKHFLHTEKPNVWVPYCSTLYLFFFAFILLFFFLFIEQEKATMKTNTEYSIGILFDNSKVVYKFNLHRDGGRGTEGNKIFTH